MKAGSDIDVGQGDLFIGTFDRGLDVGRSRLLRCRGNYLLDRDTAWRPDDHLGHGNLIGELDRVFDVGLDERLRSRRSLCHLAESRVARLRLAFGSGSVGAGSGGRIRDARRRHARILGHI
jgi:hypothetical protein